MRWPRRIAGEVLALGLRVWRRTCRYRVVNDPRPALRAAGVPYVYALLHAHQVAAVFVNDERRGAIAAMVSRSADGDLLVPSLRARGVIAVRGSSRRDGVDKGGRRALAELRAHLAAHVAPLLAVDGPRGPRNVVKLGIAALACQVPGAVVLPAVVLPTRRVVLRGTWDRFQLPLPFGRISLVFAEPIRRLAGESVESVRQRVEGALNALEAEWDPAEASAAAPARARPSGNGVASLRTESD